MTVHLFSMMQPQVCSQEWGGGVGTPNSEPFGPKKVDFLNLTPELSRPHPSTLIQNKNNNKNKQPTNQPTNQPNKQTNG